MKTSFGKVTLGGGDKMNLDLKEYNRSTHDLSFVARSTMGIGMLVPMAKILCQPGDTFEDDRQFHILTHPTVGPLFGSFKFQLDYFFCPMRLYNALLHNNTLNIGLDMKQVKLPQLQGNNIGTNEELKGSNGLLNNSINPSCLLAYLGKRSFRYKSSNDDKWQMVPLLAYYDIFKNYYANKQEDKFFTIGAAEWSSITETDAAEAQKTSSGGTWQISGGWTNSLHYYGIAIPEGSPMWGGISGYSFKLDDDTIIEADEALITNRYDTVSAQNTTWHVYSFRDGIGYRYQNKILSDYRKGEGLQLNKFDLTDIDFIREDILSKKNQQVLVTSALPTNPEWNLIKQFCTTTNRQSPLFGLVLKTYQSDIFTNYVNTEWIDGDNGINEITAINTADGSFTLDTLNLAQKVYNMLNRIAVSDGSYNSWIKTVYTSGGVPHYETPVYIGGSSGEIVFNEVVSNAAAVSEGVYEPLGTLAGRGTMVNVKGGNIHYKCDEPGYIIAIASITPRVDYCQYNDFDGDFNSLDDLHKPALDGIGFQDRLFQSFAAATVQSNETEYKKSIGKQPAWIDYMTNFNKTFGNFSILENEGFMCLNRYFGKTASGYTTYIMPEDYTHIFAETGRDAQNFWVQIGFNIKMRRVMSAKQIPNL